jgi:hypothetical protein
MLNILKLFQALMDLSYKCYKACFVDFQLFRLSSSEVVFHEGRPPDFQNFEKCFGLYWTSPTNVTKHVLLIYNWKILFRVAGRPDGGRVE